MQDSEPGDDLDIGSSLFRQSQTVFKNSGPMRNAVVAANWQGVVFKNSSKDWLHRHRHTLSNNTIPEFASRDEMGLESQPDEETSLCTRGEAPRRCQSQNRWAHLDDQVQLDLEKCF